MFRFASPEYLFLLIIIPVLIGIFIFNIYQKRKNTRLFGNPELLKQLMPNVSFRRPPFKFSIQIFVIALLILILARPQFGKKSEEVKRKGIEVMIALDISNSMLAQDVSPSRLDKAKRVLSKLIDDMENDKIGLIVFAGDAFVQLPITVDYVSAKLFLESITPDLIARQGTAIGSALDLAIKSFPAKSESSKAIILLTDGENHEDNAIEAAKLAVDNKIPVHVIGLGKPEGAPIPINGTLSFRKDKDGNVVVSKLNEQMCQEIAEAGQGVYARADNTNSAYKAVSKELDNMAKTEMTSQIFSDFNEQYQSFAMIALALIILEFFVFERKNKRLSRLRIFDLKEKLIRK